jgi:hypothetical protein
MLRARWLKSLRFGLSLAGFFFTPPIVPAYPKFGKVE